MKTKLFFALIMMAIAFTVHAGPTDEGKNIFTARCAACHNVNKIMTGPALAGVDQRRPIEWIINFVHSSQTVIKKGDGYATALFEKFNKVTMPDHPDLTADNIKNIVEYIKSEASTNSPGNVPFAKPLISQPYYIPLSIKNDYPVFIGYLVAVLLLGGTLLLAVHLYSFRHHVDGNQSPL